MQPERDGWARVTVRLLHEAERPEFDRRLPAEHSWESSLLVGESLRYVAEGDGRWVALLTFSAPALPLQARERGIGWTPRPRARRRGLGVNHGRLLVRPERQRYPPLAARGLGRWRRRWRADGQERWGHPVRVVESFVAESPHRGTCSRACGIAAVGATAGLGRARRDFYQAHGVPKQRSLRALRLRARHRLRQARRLEELAAPEAEVAGPCPFRAPALESLLERLAALPEARRGPGSAMEHGTQDRRAVPLGEDACRTAGRQGAAGLARLRNVAMGVSELQRARPRAPADSLRSGCQQQTFSTVWPLLQR